MTTITLVPIIDEGLGNSTYLLDVGDGRALVLDPERDVRTVREEAERLGLSIGWAVETHMHADFISGVRDLAATEGAEVLAPEVGGRGFPARGLEDGERVDIGRYTLEALHTPGHSPEHMSYLLHYGDRLVGVFTGGSLMVGTAGRTDLVSPDMTEPLARAQYQSLQRLMELPDETPVWPTHGAGSFCSASSGNKRVSTIGEERATNPLLRVDGEDAFVEALLGSMGSFPGYFLRLGEINHVGPTILHSAPRLEQLELAQVDELLTQGGQVIDAREAADYARGHVPGALSNTLRPVFATWLGWLVDPHRPVIFVRDPEQSAEDIAWAAANVGLEHVAGEISGGMAAWEEAGREVVPGSLDTAPALAEDPLTILDVRQQAEFAAGHVPGAYNIELGSLSDDVSRLPNGPVLVMCGHGERASTAASLLEQADRRDVRVWNGGPEDWADATNTRLEVTE